MIPPTHPSRSPQDAQNPDRVAVQLFDHERTILTVDGRSDIMKYCKPSVPSRWHDKRMVQPYLCRIRVALA